MGSIIIKFVSEDHNAFEHSNSDKANKAQLLKKKYNTKLMEQIETPDNDFVIEIDVDRNYENFDWNSIQYPNDTIKEQISEIIYFNDIKNKLEYHLMRIKYELKGWQGRRDMVSEVRKMIPILENMKISNYIEPFYHRSGSLIADQLKYTIEQKEGEELLRSGYKLSDSQKEELIKNFINRIESDLIEINPEFETMTIKKSPEKKYD